MCEVLGFSRSFCSRPCTCWWCGVHYEVCTCGQVCVTWVSVALPRPYIGGVGGPCWISLDSVWTPPSGPCWSYKTSQWVPVVLLVLWDFSVGANMLVNLHLWWYLGTIASLHSCLPVRTVLVTRNFTKSDEIRKASVQLSAESVSHICGMILRYPRNDTSLSAE